MFDKGFVMPMLMLLGIGLLYFLPTFIAVGRTHRNMLAISVTNLLLGWTAIGWLVALIWSLIVGEGEGPSKEVPSTMGNEVDEKTCPFCAETVKVKAVICKHCGSSLE